METQIANYAFIDSQNLNLGIQKLGWKLNHVRFRVYLREKYNVEKAYVFVGMVAGNQKLYDTLTEAGFVLKFKPISFDDNKKIKDNIDADLVLQAMIDWSEYNKAIVVSSDGDFYSLVDHLYKNDKLEVVLSPDIKYCATLLKQSAKEKMQYMDTLRQRLEYKKAPPEDETSGSTFKEIPNNNS